MAIVVEAVTGGCTRAGYDICVRVCTYVLEAHDGVQVMGTSLEMEWTCQAARQMCREAGPTLQPRRTALKWIV